MIRVAILGAGIGQQHLEALRQLPEFAVRLVVDQNTKRAENMRDADTFAVAETVETALADPDIDLIDVCLPPHLHVPVTLAALQAGKHVVCEKPLATSMADVEKIKDAIHKSGCHVFPVFQYRWGSPLAQLRHLIRSGLAGEPKNAALETHWDRDAAYYSAPWRGTWAGERGGAVLSHAIHNHDLLTHFFGPVAELSAFVTTRVNPIETEDTVAISFRMANGALASSNITLGAAGNETRLRFVFEHLTATSGTEPYAPGAEPWTFTARNPANQPRLDAALADCPAEPTGFVGFFKELGKSLRGEPNTAVTFDSGADSVALVTAIYHAARSKSYQSLPLTAAHPLFEGWQP